MFGEVVRFGCSPEYERVDSPEDIRQAIRKHSWDLLVGGWSHVRFAARAAQVVLEEPTEIQSISIVNYGSAALLFVIALDTTEESQASRLAASIDRMFRELAGSAVSEAELNSVASVPLGLRRSLSVRHSATAQVGHDLSNLLTVIFGCAEVLIARLANDQSGIRYMTELTAAAKSAESLAGELMSLSRTSTPVKADCELTIITIRRILQAMAGPNLPTTVKITADSTLLPIARRELEILCTEIVSLIGDRAARRRGSLEIAVGDVPAALQEECSLLPHPRVPMSFVFTKADSEPDQAQTPSRLDLGRREAADLGLTVAYRIIESAGGKLVVRESPAGIAFVVVFPLNPTS